METWSTIYALDITLKLMVAAPLLGLFALMAFLAARNIHRKPRILFEMLTTAILIATILMSPIPDALGITEDGLGAFTAIVSMASVMFTVSIFGWWDRRRGRRG